MIANDPLAYLVPRLREALFERAGRAAARCARYRRRSLRQAIVHGSPTDGRDRPVAPVLGPASIRAGVRPENRHLHRRLKNYHRQHGGRSRSLGLHDVQAKIKRSSVLIYTRDGSRLP